MPTKEEVTYVPRTYSYTIQDNVGSQTYTVERAPYIGSRSVEKDGPLPGWQWLIARGECATTSLIGTESNVDDTVADFGYTMWFNTDQPKPWQFQTVDIQGPLLSQVPPISLSGGEALFLQAENLAIQRFYQDLARAQAQFKGMVFSGELLETLRMIKSPARALRNGIGDYLRAIKKWAAGRRSSRRQKQSFVRETWLEYSYGWAPLISDLEDGLVALYTGQFARPLFTMVKSKGSARSTTPVSLGSQLDLGNAMQLRYDVESTDEANVRFYGAYHSEGPDVGKFAHFGFTPWEFVPTLYELIPFSFLVDYFTNLGEIISAWSYRNIGCKWASQGYEIKSSKKTTNIRVVYIGLQVPPHKYVVHGSPGSSTAFYRRVVRIPTVSIPLPSLALEVPGMRSTKWINIASLSTLLSATRRTLKSS